jgi:hypothetical protein
VVPTFLLTLGVCFAACFALPAATEPLPVERIFVGSLGNSAEAQQIRRALIEELGHIKIKVVEAAGAADATLTGTGEVWIKGYYSLNPRARVVGDDTHPIYGGYLSVELKGPQNEVLWSYLVTPRRYGPDPISRNLADQIVKKLREVLRH